ncbi:MAG: phosphoenolpyruvate carboxykinase (ATP) [Armatimonadetes bacterium]|nr:phosphoenolpyruvate carboxykinase (ATP) [Armatimonadota bacterium]
MLETTLLDQVRPIASELSSKPNVVNVSAEQAQELAEPFGIKTALGSHNYVSTVKNLSTALTVYLGSPRVETEFLTQKKRDIRKAAPETIKRLSDYLAAAPLIHLECTIGERSDFTPSCSLFVSTYRKDAVRLAHMAGTTLFLPRSASQADLTVVVVPEWPEKERQVLVFPEIGVTFILGSDYFGEIKNAFLRMAMWLAKERGMLGLHAGTKIVRALGPDGKIRRIGMIMFGIAATGKTTHSCHDHGLDRPGEGVEIAQDDMVFWRADGSALGSERAFYIKTDGLSADDQPLLFEAATRPEAILENVMVDYRGQVRFDDRSLTVNAHAIAPRTGMGEAAADSVNLPPVYDLDRLVLLFMVRDYTVVPIASRLTPEQAAVAFMLSESIDAAGGEQQSIAAPGGISSSPYVIGDAAVDCNMFYDLVRSHAPKIECYMLNTGGVGELVEHELNGARRVRRKVTRVSIPEMAAIIRGIVRGTIEWGEDPNWMVETPARVEDLDITKFDLNHHYDQDKIDSLIARIRAERAVYAEQFPDLNPAIRAAAEF